MEDKDHVIPKNKKAASIFFVCMLLLCVGMLILVSQPFHNASEPEDLVQVSCSFDSYEIKQHTRSISYDLLLFSGDHDLPFELSFFDGYEKQYSPEDLCTGKTYSLWVSPTRSHYEIYSCSDAEGALLMTKREAYHNSQKMAHIVLTIFLIGSISFWVVLLLIIHRPDLFSDRVKRIFFAKRKSI